MKRALLAMGLMLGSVCAEQADLNAYRTETETLLKRAKIVEIKDIGQGVTRPLKVYLKKGDREIKAIFKAVDTNMKVDAKHGKETATRYIDSYKSELAAYTLDKLIGFGQLPPIVERRVKGKKGSLRVWIDDVKPRYGLGQTLPTDDRLDIWMHTFWLFDYLVYNIDRGTHNVMLASDWSPVNIDNSMTFNTYQSPIRPLYRFPRRVIANLRALDEKQLRKAMRSYLKRDQLTALQKRIETVLKAVDERVAADGEDTVFFELN